MEEEQKGPNSVDHTCRSWLHSKTIFCVRTCLTFILVNVCYSLGRDPGKNVVKTICIVNKKL